MVASAPLADTGFLVALLDSRDAHHAWAVAQGMQFPPPWRTCECVISETFFLLPRRAVPALTALLQRHSVLVSFDLSREQDAVLVLMKKYSDIPMSLADGCLVRMTEMHAEPVLLTTDGDFRLYRRHSRQVVPCILPD
jgi:predicted nucleic acid-binding protein